MHVVSLSKVVGRVVLLAREDFSWAVFAADNGRMTQRRRLWSGMTLAGALVLGSMLTGCVTEYHGYNSGIDGGLLSICLTMTVGF